MHIAVQMPSTRVLIPDKSPELNAVLCRKAECVLRYCQEGNA
jgi:hypothetical protein